MIIATLTDIATGLGLTFLHGEKSAFNIAVDSTDPASIILYHEGYVSGQTAEDAQGAWENTYNLRLWLCIKNTGANDGPAERDPRFTLLEPLMAQVLAKLSKQYIVSQPVPFNEFINSLDRDLDGIRFVANCKPKEAPTYYC